MAYGDLTQSDDLHTSIDWVAMEDLLSVAVTNAMDEYSLKKSINTNRSSQHLLLTKHLLQQVTSELADYSSSDVDADLLLSVAVECESAAALARECIQQVLTTLPVQTQRHKSRRHSKHSRRVSSNVDQGSPPASRAPAKSDSERTPDLANDSQGDNSSSGSRGPSFEIVTTRSTYLRTNVAKRLNACAAFSPAIVHHEILRGDAVEVGKTAQPAAWGFDAALLFVDISGFTNLCTQLDIDVLQFHINSYFTRLINLITSSDGDVVRFAGDALLCAWSLPLHSDPSLLALATCSACRCALELVEKCGLYEIPEVSATLTIHIGVGVGTVCGYRVGTPLRWEVFLAGDPLRQVAMAEGCAAHGEAVCSAEAWALVSERCKADDRGSDGCKLLTAAPVLDMEEICILEGNYLSHDLLLLQKHGQTHILMQQHDYEVTLASLVHETARRAIDADALLSVGERRSVVVIFCMVQGLEEPLSKGTAALPAVQACVSAIMEIIHRSGGLLRQFILDDKGIVCIWTFGLPNNSFEDNGNRGLRSCVDVAAALAEQQLKTQIGITSGTAFCGLVGAAYRTEYSVMGPAVNLAARLMVKCEQHSVDLLCNDELYREAQAASSEFAFISYDPVSVKGYSTPVKFYHPHRDTQQAFVRSVMEHTDMFSYLTPKEQTQLLEALKMETFDRGEHIVEEGAEGQSFYIVLDGTVEVTMTHDGEITKLSTLSRGRHFGEIALKESLPRTATVTAITDKVVCMSIDRSTFTALLGPVQAILDRGSRWQPVARPAVAARRSELYAHKLTHGRQEEAKILAGQIEWVIHTAEPSVTMLSGNPGIGKTHTLRELRNFYMSVIPLIYLETSRDDREHLSVWLPLVRMLIGSHLDGGLDQLTSSVLRRFVPPSWNHRNLEHMLALIKGRSGSSANTVRDIPTEVETLSAIICALVNEPHALLLDGLERFSEPAWQVLSVVLEQRPPIAFILAARELHSWSDTSCASTFQQMVTKLGKSYCKQTFNSSPVASFSYIELLSLPETATRDLLLETLKTSSISDRIVSLVHERCGGNPAFVLAQVAQVKSAHSALKQAAAETQGSSFKSRGERRESTEGTNHISEEELEEVIMQSLTTVPPSMKKIVIAHLDHLPLGLQIILKMASALGTRVDKEVLSQTYPGPASEVDTALRSRGVRAYLQPVSSQDNSNHRYYTFISSGMCEIIYHLMLVSQRQRLHQITAEWYERLYALAPSDEIISQLAFHAVRAGDVAKAKWSLLTAGCQAVKHGSFADAESWFIACINLCLNDSDSSRGISSTDGVSIPWDNGAIDHYYTDACAALVALWLEFGECGVPFPTISSITDGLYHVLRATEASSWKHSLPTQGSFRRKVSPQDNVWSPPVVPFGTKELAIADLCHAIGWTKLASNVLGWADVLEHVGEPGDREREGAPTADTSAAYSVVKYFKRASELLLASKRSDLAARSIIGLACYYHGRARENVEESNHFYLESYRSLQKALSLTDHGVVTTATTAQILTNLALLHLDERSPYASPAEAINNAHRANCLFTIELGAHHPRLYRTLLVLAKGYRLLGDRAKELSVRRHLLRAVHFRETMLPKHRSGRTIHETSTVSQGPIRADSSSAAQQEIMANTAISAKRAVSELQNSLELPWLSSSRLARGSSGESVQLSSGLHLCERVLRADVSTEDLRDELCLAYPELGFFLGLNYKHDGLLVDETQELREVTLDAMELALRLSMGTGQDSGGRLDTLRELLQGTLNTAAALHHLLIMLVIGGLGQIALVSELDRESSASHSYSSSGTMIPQGLCTSDMTIKGAALLNPDCPIKLPSVLQLDEDTKILLANLLSCSLPLEQLCCGECDFVSLHLISDVATSLSPFAANLLLLHRILFAFGKELLSSNERTLKDAEGIVNSVVPALKELAQLNSGGVPQSAAIQSFYDNLCGGEVLDITTAKLICLLRGLPRQNAPRNMVAYKRAREILQLAEAEIGVSESHALRDALRAGLNSDTALRPIVLLGASDLVVQSMQASADQPHLMVAHALRCILRLYQMVSTSLRAPSGRNADLALATYQVDCRNVVRIISYISPAQLLKARFSIVHSTCHAYVVIDASFAEVVAKFSSMRKTTELEKLEELMDVDEDEHHLEDFVIVTDPGKDQDDELALILARTLSDMGLIKLRAVITNLAPAADRAKLARGTLDALAMKDVPVGIGTSGGRDKQHIDSSIADTGINYLKRKVSLDGTDLLLRTYEEAKPNSITLLLIASLTDAADFIKSHEELFARKTCRVAIMGGVMNSVDPSKPLEPDPTAQNFKFDFDAAKTVFERCQKLKVSLVVLSRSAAYAASVPAFIYDELGALGHPVALKLRAGQLKAIASLWRRVCLPPEHEGRNELPSRCDRSWFSLTFCGGANLEAVSGDQSVWPYITSLIMYDPITMLAAHPVTLQAFFEVDIRTVNGVEHIIVGPTDEQPGVRDPHKIRSFLINALRHALATSINSVKELQDMSSDSEGQSDGSLSDDEVSVSPPVAHLIQHARRQSSPFFMRSSNVSTKQ